MNSRSAVETWASIARIVIHECTQKAGEILKEHLIHDGLEEQRVLFRKCLEIYELAVKEGQKVIFTKREISTRSKTCLRKKLLEGAEKAHEFGRVSLPGELEFEIVKCLHLIKTGEEFIAHASRVNKYLQKISLGGKSLGPMKTDRKRKYYHPFSTVCVVADDGEANAALAGVGDIIQILTLIGKGVLDEAKQKLKEKELYVTFPWRNGQKVTKDSL